MFIHNRKKLMSFGDGEDVNPMDFTGNLSDIMLVLAVGIMLALVAAYNVNLNGVEQGAYTPVKVAGTTQIEIPLDSAQTTGEISDDELAKAGFTEYGTVFTDAEGNLYILGAADE